MEQGYDEELEKLLGEIPRATSTPVEELQGGHPDDCQGQEHAKDTLKDGATVVPTLNHHLGLMYTPFSEAVTTPPSMNTLAFDEPMASPLSPFYGGLPSPSSYKLAHLDMAKKQARNSIDPGLTSDCSILRSLSPSPPSYNLNHLDMSEKQGRHSIDPGFNSDGNILRSPSGHIPWHGNANQEVVLPLRNDTQANAELGKFKKGNGSSSSISSGPHMDSLSSDLDVSSAPCLSQTLQLLDSYADGTTSEVVDHELHNELDKLTLVQNGPSSKNQPTHQLPGKCFFQLKPSPPQGQGAGSVYFSETTISTAATMQFGSLHAMADGGLMLPDAGSFVHPYPSDMDMIYAERMQGATAAQEQQMEETVLCRQRIKEEFLLRQQKLQEQQARFYESLQSQPGCLISRGQPQALPYTPNILQQQSSPKKALISSFMPDMQRRIWAASAMSGEPPEASNVCKYCFQGFCLRDELCPLSHSCQQGHSMPASHELTFPQANMTLKGRNGLIAPTAVLPASRKRILLANGHLLSNGTHLPSPYQFRSMSGGNTWNGLDSEILQSVSMRHLAHPEPLPSAPPKYTTLKEVEGHIYGIAKDQHGCRFLQRKFEEGVFEDVQKIFVEIIDHVVELMTDPFGNYLVQKLLEVCNEAQRMQILYKVAGNDQLVTISLNMHGTRAVQKLIETLRTAEQVRLVVSSLKHGVVTLIKDLNGNHVVQRCLQHLSADDSQFIFDAAASHCVEIATHRHGCCVLQRCIDFSLGQQRDRLVAEIAANALVLSQDPFGNYVVQYILELGLMWTVTEVISRLNGNYVHLSMQKFSSNVVEKCLKLATEESKARIIRELMSSARLAHLLQDPFANYVVQSALTVSKGTLHSGLVEAIRPHLPALRSSPYGKRILSRASLKK